MKNGARVALTGVVCALAVVVMLLTALALMGWMLELLLTGGKDREE